MNAIYFFSSTNKPKNLTSEKSKIFKGGGRVDLKLRTTTGVLRNFRFGLIWFKKMYIVQPEERTKTTIFPVFWSLQFLSTKKNQSCIYRLHYMNYSSWISGCMWMVYVKTAVYKLQYMNIRLYVNCLCIDCSI